MSVNIQEKMLQDRVKKIAELFEEMDGVQASNWQVQKVTAFRKANPALNNDLDFCFEVLAGKHKLGITFDMITASVANKIKEEVIDKLSELTIESYYRNMKDRILILGTGYVSQRYEEEVMLELDILYFMKPLINREYRLGYSNKAAMVTKISPMLAKKYPDDHQAKFYFVQEKLDGNRCIAYYSEDEFKWKFRSRSGKALKVDFDMSWVENKQLVFDGEVMTLGKAGSRDFNKTSGSINGKYTDKSALHYYIYDVILDGVPYNLRKGVLDHFTSTGEDCSILPALGLIALQLNPDYNGALDDILNKIVAQGGEGIMLRDPDGLYVNGRSANLLKYKKVKTMDLRVIDIVPGTGKYEDMIGSLTCRDDENTILVNVGSGLSDEDRMMPDEYWKGNIVEVAYFDTCKSDKKEYKSLRFPRLKGLREDKHETSKY